MEVWASYSLNDLLLFSPTTYFRLYEIHNSALWPLHLLMIGVGLALLLLTREKGPGWDWVVFLLLGILWGFVGWFFLYQQYAQINNAAPWFALGFGIQSILFIWVAIFKRDNSIINGWRYSALSRSGLLLFLYALAIHPFIGVMAGRSWTGAELFGMAPDPTVIGTIGILLMCRGNRAVILSVMPILWILISGLTYLAIFQGP